MRVSELLEFTKEIVPDNMLVVEGDRRLSYAETALLVGQTAGWLIEQGIGPGDFVAAMVENCLEFPMLLFATSQIGATFVPLNNRSKADEVAYMINDCGARVLFFSQRYAPIMQEAMLQCKQPVTLVCLEGQSMNSLAFNDVLAGLKPMVSMAEVDDTEAAVVLYTSGTTGKPKGVVLSHANLTNRLLETEPMLGSIGQVNLVSVPLFHIAALMPILTSVWSGRMLVILRQFTPEAWLTALVQHQVTHAFVVPTMLTKILAAKPNANDVQSLQLLTYGAAPMPYVVIREAIDRWPSCRFSQGYGQTESTGGITLLSPEDHMLAGLTGPALAEKEERLRSVGRAIPGVELLIVDASGNLLPPNHPGEICVVSAGTMQGYWGNQAATQTALAANLLHTGDVGYLDADGYLFITGRLKDMIIRGGENIGAGEVEAVLLEHPAVTEAAVIGVPDTEFGEKVKAILVLQPGQPEPTLTELTNFAKQSVASYKVPEYLVWVAELPRNPTGKVLKPQLREIHGGADNN